MPDYRKMVEELFLAPARGWLAQSPKAPPSMGLLGDIHNAIDPVQAFGGYGGLAAMALPPGGGPKLPKTMKIYRVVPETVAEGDAYRPKRARDGVYAFTDPKAAREFQMALGGKIVESQLDKVKPKYVGDFEIELMGGANEYGVGVSPQLYANSGNSGLGRRGEQIFIADPTLIDPTFNKLFR